MVEPSLFQTLKFFAAGPLVEFGGYWSNTKLDLGRTGLPQFYIFAVRAFKNYPEKKEARILEKSYQN